MNNSPIIVTNEELAEYLGVSVDTISNAVDTAVKTKAKTKVAGVVFWNLIFDEDEDTGLCWAQVCVFTPSGERFVIDKSAATFDYDGNKIADGVIF